ncbi:hypothetical protein JHK84_049320 [Glycine max]|nr:hypothetical protein JHK86_049280 [Glycine max]KAG5093732.1 hypothetical protein JHK84_049320 [Glycine max]
MVALIFWAYRERQYQKHYRRRYSWWQYQFCDVLFIEVIKPYFIGNDPYLLQLLHPFMSFVMEELWQRLPSPRECKRAESIMISCDYPSTIEVITENDAVPLGYADTVVNEKPFCLSRASKN